MSGRRERRAKPFWPSIVMKKWLPCAKVEYDSDDEYIVPRQQIRQPLPNGPQPPATGAPVAEALDQRPSRDDAWSTRMREKYGLDTSEFTYNPSESGSSQQVSTQPAEERSRCTIM